MTIVTIEPQQPNSPVHLHVELVTTLNVSGVDARKRANRVILDQMTTGLAARVPELAVSASSSEISWRVPIILSLPKLGDVGQVGTISINAKTGVVSSSQAELDHMLRIAELLYVGATSSTK
ncbi:MAG: hypothetical protein HC853_06455 [Anaerolineae bacterium]|nr:hypothetical protein [Anaerolineae bacterium]